MDAVQWVRDVFQRRAEAVFLIDAAGGAELTYAQVAAQAAAVAADLKARGLKKGDRVALSLPNSPSFAVIYFGLMFAGLVAVPVNPAVSPRDAAYILKSSGARLFLVSPATARLAGGGIPEGCRLLCLSEAAEAPADWEAWLPHRLDPAPEGDPLAASRPEDTLCIVYTSGTTAEPKGVVHRLRDLIDNGRLFCQHLGIGPDNRFYGILAMAYLGGYYNLLLLPFCAGSSLVVSRTFDAGLALDFWGPARAHGVNTLWLVPTIMSILMQMDRTHEGEEFCRRSVELCLCGTAPLPDRVRQEFSKRYGLRVHENYGLSETLFIATQSPFTAHEGVGGVLPGVAVTIRDREGQPLSPGREGEVAVATPYLMEGYFDKDVQAPAVLEPGSWFPTGDLGILTPAGQLSITGRIKDLVIKGGVNISPTQVENVLLEHPSVRECAVVGIPHPVYGEEVAAVLELAGSTLAEAEASLKEHCLKQLGGAEAPAKFFAVERLPRNPAGKVLKNELRRMIVEKAAPSEAAAPAAPGPAAPLLLGTRVRRGFERAPQEVIADLKEFGSALISDCQNRLGAMQGAIRPLAPGRPFAGSAFTVEEVEGGNLMSHLALELVQPGDVLVIDAKGVTSRACFGGVQLGAALQRGVAALVIDGAVRDLDEIVAGPLPVYARGASPAGPLKGWGGHLNQPLACGGVAVLPGDVIIGDDDGVVVVRRELAAQVADCCRRRRDLEERWVQEVAEGRSTVEAVGLGPQLQKLDITYE